MVGRTFQQHAAPITFGYKAAVWLDELLRHRDRLAGVRQRGLVAQLGGAVGTLATLGDKGLNVRKEFARELDLHEPAISWHTARDSWAEIVHWIAMVGASLGKIATEIATLMRTEVDEIREPYQVGRGSSSTMPQKRNPISAPPIIAIASRIRECVSSQLAAMIQEHERSVSGQPLEWLIIPDAFLLISGALKHSRDTLGNLDVNASRMKENLSSGGGFLMAESVMMGLAKHVGKSEAHQLVAKAAGSAMDQGKPLKAAILSDEMISSMLTPQEIESLFESTNYLGCSNEMINIVLEKVKKSNE
ncbi:UNVERIFIED_CONTAM: hypothetical protein GTU68_047898 [Idotea baltica]|nr:hypothetical protein [Idotea baltica]